MSGYLSRLKQIENEKNFHNSPESELTKPPKGASVSFVSSNSRKSEKKFNDPPDSSKESGLLSVSFVSSISEENKKNSDIQLLQIEMIQAWLHRIGEPPEDHHIVLSKCRNDPEALAYFLKHARGEFE
ncbi:MAG: hypothetical protein HRU77_08450 [Gammaproteobacteria bacterium]|nr:MAG: hypothetical protein HRU77_08450 [Gammaproteobacteria bacterium]